jgi:hypothetical protein
MARAGPAGGAIVRKSFEGVVAVEVVSLATFGAQDAMPMIASKMKYLI